MVSTYEHQQLERMRSDLRPSQLPSQPEQLSIRAWISEARCWRLEDPGQLSQLADYLPLQPAELEQRFTYKTPWLALLALRLYRCDQPIVIPRLPGYGGCRSWLKLDRCIDLHGQPVISDDDWQQHLALLQSLLSPSP